MYASSVQHESTFIFILLGNTFSFDESVYTYYGYDATDSGIYTMISGIFCCVVFEVTLLIGF